MRFLNGYTQHPLLKFSPGSRSSALLTPIVSGFEAASHAVVGKTGETNTAGEGASNGAAGGGAVAVRGRDTAAGARAGAYPLSTVVVVALIAFLVGSLLRSLLSPADFIYVVTDEGEMGSAGVDVGTGWREIKRLLEVKYVVGGWDFQIAVVRRH